MKIKKRIIAFLLVLTMLPVSAFAEVTVKEVKIKDLKKNTPIEKYNDCKYFVSDSDPIYLSLAYIGKVYRDPIVASYINGYKREYKSDKEEIAHIGRYIRSLGIEYKDGISYTKQISSLKNKEAECWGFAWITAKILDKSGINYRIVITTSCKNPEDTDILDYSHINLEAEIDGIYRTVEPTYFRANKDTEEDGYFIEGSSLSDEDFERLFSSKTTLADYSKIDEWFSVFTERGYNYVKGYYSPIIKGGKIISTDSNIFIYSKWKNI